MNIILWVYLLGIPIVHLAYFILFYFILFYFIFFDKLWYTPPNVIDRVFELGCQLSSLV
jgi:hypothetical protein